MVPLIKMIQSENLKIYSRKSAILMILSIPVMVFLFAVTGRTSGPVGENLWGLVAGHIVFVFLINIFTVIIAAGVIANEFSWGTIKLLLIRPFSRGKILLAKYLAVIIFSMALLILLFCSSLIINLLLYGLGNTGDGSILGVPGKRLLFNSFNGVILLYILKYIEVIIYGTIALTLSVISKSNALTIGVSLLAMIFGPEVTDLFANHHWSRYILFANLNLTQNIADGRLFRTQFPFSLAVLFVYWLVFLAISWLVFTKRDVLN